MRVGEQRVGEQFCPGVLHPVQAMDGLLLRIRTPGGMIAADQLRTIADLSRSFADGAVEITSRSNLQLRAIRGQDLSQIVAGISSAGFLPSPLHDRVRNLVASPIAGLDGEELIDPRPLIRELDRRLRAETVFANLHPKFSFAIHGGPRRFSPEVDDLSLEAVMLGAAPHFHLCIGGASSGFAVRSEDAVHCMLAAAKMCIGLAKQSRLPVRGKNFAASPGGMEGVAGALSHLLAPSALSPSSRFEEALLGAYPTPQPDRVSIIPSVALGRLTAEQAHCVADAAERWDGDLRLAPWRGVVLGSIPKSAADDVIGRLLAAGLSCDGRDGFRGIAACAGIGGCGASLADVRGDAVSLARRLAGCAAPAGWTVNLSGCEKQCGRRRGAAAELVAGPSGYSLKIAGRPVASGCSRDFAMDAVAARRRELLSEAAAR